VVAVVIVVVVVVTLFVTVQRYGKTVTAVIM